MPRSLTFIIEIPGDLEFSDEDKATLEGHFAVDVGNLLDEKGFPAMNSDNTNVGNVRVSFRQQEAARKSASETDKKGTEEGEYSG